VGVLPESLAQLLPEELEEGQTELVGAEHQYAKGSHESPVLSVVYQELLLQSVLSVLNGLKHG
jgi:hypothetical protein